MNHFKIWLILLAVLQPLTALAADSTRVSAPKVTGTMKYQSQVDTSNCITTDKAIWAAVAGTGGGSPDQRCPEDHPIMYSYNQTMAYTTAVPWTGAVMGAGGNTSAVCCAIVYRWVPS